MATNLDIITAAYRMGNVIPMTQDPNAELSSSALSALNDMLATWAEDKIDLGWFPQESLSAEAPLNENAVEGVKANLAIILVGIAGMEPPAWVDRQAHRTYNTLLRAAVSDALEPADMTHLPYGTARGVVDITN